MRREPTNLNHLQRVVYARLQALQLEAGAAETVSHSGTIGTLREGYLRRFLKDMTLGGISLTSGALLNLRDDVSPQIDIIAALDSTIPRLILEESISLVPAEAALIAIEVKSKLKRKHLNQVQAQNEWIKNTKLTFPQPDRDNQYKLIIPTAILAYDSALSFKAVEQWMQSDGGRNTALCCVIGKFYIHQFNEIKRIQGDGQFKETMNFISDYWFTLQVVSRWRELAADRRLDNPGKPYPHPLEAYLKGLGQQ